MEVTQQEFPHVYQDDDGQPIAVSPRPGLWFGECLECQEWRPLVTEPFRTTQLAEYWEALDGTPIKVNWEIEKDIPVVIDIDEEPYLICQQCWDAEEQESNENDLYDYDPEALSEEVRQRIRQERKELKARVHQHQSHKYRITLQCAVITKKGRHCKRTATSWDYAHDPDYAEDRPADTPFTDADWWVCNQHAPDCLHCTFASRGMLPGTFRLKPKVLFNKAIEPVGRGLVCDFCLCTFTPSLDVAEAGEPCSIWGRGQRPGTIGDLVINHPEVISQAMEYVIEEEYKRKRLAEWRKQFGQAEGGGE
jgi:hypothetical protein